MKLKLCTLPITIGLVAFAISSHVLIAQETPAPGRVRPRSSVILGKSTLSRATSARPDRESGLERSIGVTTLVFDLVVSMANDAQGSVNFSATRAQYEEIIGFWADAVYEMSNATLKLGRVIVFRNSANNAIADVFWKANGKPRAPVSGFQGFGGIQFCDVYTNGCSQPPPPVSCSGANLAFLNSAQSRKAAGWALGHEFGHYVLGLYDEYTCGSPCTLPVSPSLPQVGDFPVLESIMSNPFRVLDSFGGPDHYEWGNFSTILHAPYDSPSGTTPQRRVYQASGWGTRARAVTSDPPGGTTTTAPPRQSYIPAGAAPTGSQQIDLPSTASRSNLTIDWPADAIDMQLILDRSGSMSGTPLANAQVGAGVLIDSLVEGKTALGVVSFDDVIEQAFGISPISNSTDKNNAKTAVNALTARNTTAMFDAAMFALSGLLGFTPAAPTRLAFLLTDGLDNASSASEATVISSYLQNRVPLIVFGYGSFAPNGVLARMASQTRGIFRASPTDFGELQEAFLAAQTATSAAVGVVQTDALIPATGTTSFSFAVDSTLSELGIVTATDACLADLDFSLVGPSGPVPVTFVCREGSCDPDPNIADATSCSAFVDATLVAQGGIGTWNLIATNHTSSPLTTKVNIIANPNEELTYDLVVSSVNGTSVEFPQPILIAATVSKELPITGVEVIATLTSPSGTTSFIELKDAGMDGDAVAGDGVYSAILDYTENGVHTIDVTVFNPIQTAEFTVSGYAPCPFFSPTTGGTAPVQDPLPLIFEDFTRTASVQVLVSGVLADDHPDVAPGTPVAADNVSLPGKINFAGDPDVFSVPTGGLDFITLRVTGLALGMEPRLRVLGEDGTTELAVVTRADIPVDFDYVAVTLHTGGNAVLHAEVTHAAGATGTYDFSAGRQIVSDAPYLTVMDIKPGSCPNVFNRKSNGVLKVALVGTDEFPVSAVDLAFFELMRLDGVEGRADAASGPQGLGPKIKDVATPFTGNPCDCHALEGDGVPDIELTFRSDELVSQLRLQDLPSGTGTFTLALRGARTDGLRFQASDCLKFVPPR